MAPSCHPQPKELDLDQRSNPDGPAPVRDYAGNDGEIARATGDSPGRVTPPSDMEGKNRSIPRRRIPVAVCSTVSFVPLLRSLVLMKPVWPMSKTKDQV
jgi:hypothetical protein